MRLPGNASQNQIEERYLAKIRIAALAFVLGTTLAFLSVLFERRGPEQVQYGNLCGVTFDQPCYRPELKGGFPFAFLFDTPGISVENQLSFAEDQLFLSALALDIAAYVVVVFLSLSIASRWRQNAVNSAAARGNA
jgi:hypothetical protein